MAARNYDTMNRAEKFEDEKRRIIESCFSKREDDNTVSESYITHIRIEEDAAYPSTPPPLDSPKENKKPRVIIVAVRKAGRVRMHKARENSNGTFSIGKTWMLDHLSAIESFTGGPIRGREDEMKRASAGDTGMTITIQKPYFWKAVTSKEKDFFIGSLIKIHRKYAGRDPELTGFTDQEMTTFVGIQRSATRAVPQNGPQGDAQSRARNQGTSSTDRLRPGPGPVGGETGPSSNYGRGAGPPPPPQDDRLPASRDRYQSTGSNISTSSNRTASSRRDRDAPAMPDNDPFQSKDPRARLQGRNGSPAASTISSDSYGGSTYVDDRRGPSISSFDSASTRTEIPPGRISGERQPPNGPSPLARNGTPNPPLPPPGPRSPQRAQAQGYGGSLATAQIQNGVPSMPPAAEVPPERRRPPMSSGSNEPVRGTPLEPPLRSEQRRRLESDASSGSPARDASISDISRPSTGRQPSPNRPPALNLAAKREDLLRPAPTPAPAPVTASPEPTTTTSSSRNIDSAVPPAQSEPEQRSPQRQSRERKDPIAPPPIATVSDMASALSMMSPTDSTAPSTPATPAEESYRPGLGPMIKKKKSAKDVANMFKKAANAQKAFQPRAGGAAAKLRDVSDNGADGADGVSGVFIPAAKSPVRATFEQSLAAESLDGALAGPRSPTSPPPIASVPEPLQPAKEVTPSPAPIPAKPTPPEELKQPEPAPKAEPPKERGPTAEEIRKKQLSQNAAKYARALGVNPVLLEGRTADIEGILEDIGWKEGKQTKRTYDDLLSEIKRELTKVETGSWLDAFEGTDDRVVAVSTMLDKAIAECEELDGLLTLYNVELGTLNDDVQFIEAQSQGLQVQTANQRQLHMELNNLLKTISISPNKLAVVRDPSLNQPDGLAKAEDALSELYKALRTIAPAQIGNSSLASAGISSSDRLAGDVGGMKAVEERKNGYLFVASGFTTSLGKFLGEKFYEAEKEVQSSLERSRGSLPADVKFDAAAWEPARARLWMYSPVLMFARDVVFDHWENLVYNYANVMKNTYRKELRSSIDAWRLAARKATGAEQDALFTTQDKEEASMTRKLTVKRSKTLREGPRVAPGDRRQEGKIPPYQAFYNALLEISKAIFVEQNFVARLFHASAVDITDFTEMVASSRPEDRGSENLLAPGMPEPPNSRFGSIVKRNMELIFASFATDVQGLIDQIISQDPLHIIGLMWAVEVNSDKTAHTNQEFLSSTLNAAQAELSRRYDRFVEEQISAIDATKVKISKRKGVIPFMKVFPLFALMVEDQLPTPAADDSEVRKSADAAYDKIHRAMFLALTVVGNKDQETNATGGTDEEKEALNQHILLIENYNHYVEEVDVRNCTSLISGRTEALSTMDKHMRDYVDSVVRRPLGQLLSAVESAEAAVKAAGSAGPSSIATLASHRANTFKKNVGGFDAKEIRKGVDLLRKRVEKHFGDADDERISSKLVEKVTQECEQKYQEILERLNKIIRDVYEGQMEIELRPEDITAAFHQR